MSVVDGGTMMDDDGCNNVDDASEDDVLCNDTDTDADADAAVDAGA